MLRSRKSKWSVVVGLIASMAVLAPGAAAGSARAPDDGCKVGELRRGLIDIDRRAAENWPHSYGDYWLLDGSPRGRVAIAFTRDAEARVDRLAEGYCRPENLMAVTVEYSVRRLRRVQREIVRDRDLPPAQRPDGLPRRYDVGTMVTENRVFVGVRKRTEELEDRFQELYGEMVIVREGLSSPDSAPAASRRGGRGIALAKFDSADSIKGRVEAVLYPNRAELDLRLSALPRRRAIVVWLVDGKTSYVGGAVPSRAQGRFNVSAIVPGDKSTSRSHAREATRIFVTETNRRKARNRLEAAQEDGWRKPLERFGREIGVARLRPLST